MKAPNDLGCWKPVTTSKKLPNHPRHQKVLHNPKGSFCQLVNFSILFSMLAVPSSACLFGLSKIAESILSWIPWKIWMEFVETLRKVRVHRCCHETPAACHHVLPPPGQSSAGQKKTGTSYQTYHPTILRKLFLGLPTDHPKYEFKVQGIQTYDPPFSRQEIGPNSNCCAPWQLFV